RPGGAAVVEGRFGHAGHGHAGRHRCHPYGAGPAGLGTDPAGAAPARPPARRLALRRGQGRPPRRRFHRPGLGPGPGADGAAAAELRPHRPARALAPVPAGGRAQSLHRQRAAGPGGSAARLRLRTRSARTGAVPDDPRPPGRADGEPSSGADYPEDSRARRMAEREFNLSSAETLRTDNEVVAGRFWAGRPEQPELSVEQELARDLGWQVGDEIAFDIAGARFAARITSLRKVDWESFQPNFFVLASPGALDGFSGSHITAVKVPVGDARFTTELVRAFPNLSVVDVDAV